MRLSSTTLLLTTLMLTPAIVLAQPCKTRLKATPNKLLTGPVAESRINTLLPGLPAGTTYEASGVFALNNSCFVVFDNLYQAGEIPLHLQPENSRLHDLSRHEGNPDFEAITYDAAEQQWYIVAETELAGNRFRPVVYRYDRRFTLIDRMETDLFFAADKRNKGLEGIAFVRRNGQAYLLGLEETSNSIHVLQQQDGQWKAVAELLLPVYFNDYADIAVLNNRVAVISQEDARIWIGQLSPSCWKFTGKHTVYTIPTGNENGETGKGNRVLYGNLEGVSFANDSTLVTCTDQVRNSQPVYQQHKDQSIQVWRIR